VSGRHFDWSTNLSGRQNNASYPGETGGLFANFAIFDIIKLEKLVAHRKMFVGMSRLVAAVIILLLFVSFAAAKARVALVIGNSSYQHVPELPNPKNDAATVAAKLKSIGFEVIEAGISPLLNCAAPFAISSIDCPARSSGFSITPDTGCK